MLLKYCFVKILCVSQFVMGPSFCVCVEYLNCVCRLFNSGFHFDWTYGEGGDDGVVGG